MESVISIFTQEGGLDFKKKDRWKIPLFLLGFAFFLRVFLVLSPEVVHNDGVEYVRHAKQISSGDWSGEKAPPFYPMLISGAQWVTQNYEMAGIWISVIFGSLLVLPIFYLGKTLFNETVGILSGVFAAIHPSLYFYSGSVLTESTYYFLLINSVLLGWNAFTSARYLHIFLFSFFTTLAYLTKPEAIAILLIFSLWVLWINPPSGKRPWEKRVEIILVALFSFMVFAFPYLMKIRMETGKWGISQKVVISIGSFSGEEGVPSIDEIRRRKEFPLVSLLKDPLTAMEKAGMGILTSVYKFQQAFNPLLFIFAVLGWVFLLKRENVFSLKGNLFLFIHLLFFFGMVYPFFFVTRRHTSQMVVLSIPWAAAGCACFLEWFAKRFKKEQVRKRIPIFFLILLAVGLLVQGSILHRREHRFIQREVGLWMKENLDRGGKMMSRRPQEAFYADLPWIRISDTSYEKILRVARSNQVRYLIIDDGLEKDSPSLLEKIRGEDLVLIKDFKDQNYRMMVFEIVYPE